ncbi:MAG: hypothetical protein QME66_10440 [Candidatus Eisenbacteria bacterium]|nr:hypothetical protein [Candidatus Eisenbacteria bacterium]
MGIEVFVLGDEKVGGKMIRLVLPQVQGGTYTLNANYVIVTQIVTLLIKALAFPDNQILGEPLVIGSIGIYGTPTVGAGIVKDGQPFPST